ncbi:hypothetical protein FK531_05205 [Rhodococcus spelaei]|uniref:Lipoprotein n=1 Tax=Rhodococcus spelaei TaxID=2546320 RepID=A0A541BNZ0_9NOCA|nr:hypothetical protein [Rhodococcus spelaei]TQF74057.1 hypothetical protein FK531_05205 [Rhodococcus spelaei]
MRHTAIGVLLLAAVAGCSDSAGSGDGTVVSSPAATSPAPIMATTNPTPVNIPGADPGTVFIPDAELVDAHPTPFQSYSVLGAGDVIGVHFTAGNPECVGADATVTESDTSVAIALRTGTRADAVGKACTMIAVPGTMEVPLREPLGTRLVTSR